MKNLSIAQKMITEIAKTLKERSKIESETEKSLKIAKTLDGEVPAVAARLPRSLRPSRRAFRRAAPPSAPHAPLRPPHSAPSRRSAPPFAFRVFAL